MARKKTSKQKTPSSQEFSHSPFKSLKGLSAFEESRPRDTAAETAQTEAKETRASSNDQLSFADEMDFLGVKPLPDRVVETSRAAKGAAAKVSPAPNSSREECDRVAFLEAVGAMETTFKDEWPDVEAGPKAVPRRMKQVERGQLKPEAELDLHGLTVDEAAAKVRFFLQDAVFHGFQTILLIPGKGLHSSEGPVLREAVEKLLAQSGDQVLEWGSAPRRYGGDGALVVFLRRLVVE